MTWSKNVRRPFVRHLCQATDQHHASVDPTLLNSLRSHHLELDLCPLSSCSLRPFHLDIVVADALAVSVVASSSFPLLSLCHSTVQTNRQTMDLRCKTAANHTLHSSRGPLDERMFTIAHVVNFLSSTRTLWDWERSSGWQHEPAS